MTEPAGGEVSYCAITEKLLGAGIWKAVMRTPVEVVGIVFQVEEGV